MKRPAKLAFLVLVAGILGIQFIPVERTNRLGTGDPDAPRDVQWTLRRACYDCHSTETRWPIWAYVAPMSWQVVADVKRARQVLNFSDWMSADTLHRKALRRLVGQATATHRMPLWYYVTLHPDAHLSPEDRAALDAWAKADVAERSDPAPAPPPR